VLRLPRNFVPTGYAATLAIDPAKPDFDGAIAITGNVSERSSVIWLHGHRLKVKRAIARRGASEIALTATPHGDDLLQLRAATPLDAGSWTLAIDYTGVFEEVSTTGAFKQTVRGDSYVYTQFEALYARRVFPCLDEPDNKVPWQLTLEVPATLVAVSNTPVESEEVLGDRKRVQFEATPPLPSYLIAFGVGPFDIVDAGKTASGTPVRVVTMRGRGPEAAWAAKTSARVLDLLEEYFGSKYPYAKMDMLTIPVTVGFGAMENVGLITYSETLMLLDPKHPGRGREYSWILVAAHELGHQWFGNVVTMAWWDDIWLNEGFATWVARKISARFEPTWHDELSEIEERNQALSEDGLVSARQIRQPITTPGDILNAFDGITYQKGASVLNMFEGYLGSEVFVRGVREYLQRHALGNATSADFAAALSRAAGKDVTAAFATFLEQPGAPEITATLVCDRGQPPRVALSQQRYLPPGAPPASANKPWIVPVCVAFDRGGKRAETCSLLDAPTGSITLDAATCPRWMMPNANGRGYYRNAYTSSQVAALRDDAWQHLKPTERRVLFFDTADAFTVGKLPLTLVMSFVPRLIAAGDRFSIRAALDLPVGMKDMVPDELRGSYEAWLRRTFGPAARKFGWSPRDSDGLDVEAVRASLLAAVADVAREPALSAEAVKLAANWRELPPSIRAQVISIAADLSPKMFERLRGQVYTETDRARRQEIVFALAKASDVKLQRAALDLMLDPKVDIRDTQFMMFGARGEKNRDVARQFVRDHKDAIMKRLPTEGTTSSQAYLAYVFTGCSPGDRDEIVEYVNRHFAVLQGGARVVKQAIEGMDQCIARRKLMEPEIRAWLSRGRGVAASAKAAR
jgi:cytosol alanyl aminopeptidase